MLTRLSPAQGGPADARDRRQGRERRAHARRARGAEQRPLLGELGRTRRGRSRRSRRHVPRARAPPAPDDPHAEPLRVDATPPVVKVRHIGPHVVEPGARLKVRYLLNEPARVYVFLNGKRVVLGRSTRLKWKVEWPVRGRPGKYRVTLAARDVAGNLSDASRAVTIVIPLRVLTPRVDVAAGKRFAVRLATDGRAYHWDSRSAARSRASRRLVLRAPKQAGSLHARRQAGQGAAPDRRRGEEEVSAEAARIAGAVASVGLAVLIVARPREARVAGLGAWAIGSILLAFYLAPSSHERVLAAAAVVGRLVAVGLALLFRRWPWALAFLTLACVPARIPVRVGGTEANLLVPLYARRRGRGARARLGAPARRQALARARAARWPLAALRRVDGVSLLWIGRPAPGRDRRVLLLPAVRPAGGVALAPAVESARRVGCSASWSRWRSCSPGSASTSRRRATSSGTRR